MRISDWSSDVCSSDLHIGLVSDGSEAADRSHRRRRAAWSSRRRANDRWRHFQPPFCAARIGVDLRDRAVDHHIFEVRRISHGMEKPLPYPVRSEEHTSELQSLMRTSYDVFCFNKHQPKMQHKEKQ